MPDSHMDWDTAQRELHRLWLEKHCPTLVSLRAAVDRARKAGDVLAEGSPLHELVKLIAGTPASRALEIFSEAHNATGDYGERKALAFELNHVLTGQFNARQLARIKELANAEV